METFTRSGKVGWPAIGAKEPDTIRIKRQKVFMGFCS